MRRVPVALLLISALVGCGVPSDPTKQAEEVHSVAAEGALLAHDAAEGDTLATFTGAHARALRERLDELRPAIREEPLARVADRVAGELERLTEAAGAEPEAGRAERALEQAADAAERLAR